MVTLNRDSLLLWLPIVGAAFAYLMAGPPPTEWAWHDWMKAGAAFVAALSTRMQTSPLESKQAANVGAATAKVVEARRNLEKVQEQVMDDAAEKRAAAHD